VAKITAIFWDIGGVLLTNGWDRPIRRRAAEVFGLEWDEFEARHKSLENGFDTALLTLDQYMDQAIFQKSRPFSREKLKEFMYSQSLPHPEVISIVADLAREARYFLATLNNEPLELNQYRIEKFGLRQYFGAFFSSSFLGVAKPDPAIYRRALLITQRSPGECLFIDDRTDNLESASQLGIRTLHYQGDPPELRRRLADLLQG
jgi:putative hydrolase of the HAD superfamily